MPPLDSNQEDDLLTVAEVADRLDVSLAYGRMLCDRGVLGGVVLDQTGVRRVRLSKVNIYLASHQRQGDLRSLMQAAKDAGLYDIPEEDYVGYVRPLPGSDETS